MDEVGGSVEGVNHPSHVGRTRVRAALLRQDGVLRPVPAEYRQNCLLGGSVRVGHEVMAGRLVLDDRAALLDHGLNRPGAGTSRRRCDLGS